jgi:hypothetical protein
MEFIAMAKDSNKMLLDFTSSTNGFQSLFWCGNDYNVTGIKWR